MDRIKLDSILSPDVISVTPDTPLSEALSILSEKKISCLLVVENNKPVGILTERDVVKIVGGSRDMLKKKLPEVMSSPVITVQSGMDILEGYAVLKESKIRHLVVADEQGAIEGVVTQTDILEKLETKLTDKQSVFEIMTRKIVISNPDDTIHEISRKMLENSIRCIIIEDDSKPVGIITERDIARIFLSGVDVSVESVSNWMSSPVVTINSNVPVSEAMHLMSQKKHRSLIVHDDNAKTIGLVTQRDIIRELLEGNYLKFLRASVKKQELALHDSEKKYKTLIETIPHGIQENNTSGIITFSNLAHAKMLGYESGELLGKAIWDFFVSDEEKNNLRKYLKKLVKEQPSPTPYVCKNLTKDGRLIDVQVDWNYKRDKEGNLTGFISVISDITERKQSENKLKNKTKFIQLLQEVTVTANEATTAEEAIQACLGKVCDHMDWPVGHVYEVDSKGKLIPSKIWHIKNAERFDVFRKISEVTSFNPGVGLPGRVLATGKPAWITDVTHDQNFPRAKLAKGIGVKAAFGLPVLEGKKVVAVLEFFSNEAIEPDEPTLEALSNLAVQVGRVTERKKAEDSLHDYQQQMYLFSLTTTNLLWNWDLINGTIERNIGFEKAFGYTKEEIVPNIEWWVDRLHPNDRERVLSVYENAVKKGDNTCSYEYRFRCNDGNYSHISDEVYIIRDENGKAIRSLGAMTDITERKQVEDALKESEQRFRLHIEGLDLIAVGLDNEGNITYANPALCKLFGLSGKELIGKNWIEDFIPEGYQPESKDVHKLHVKKGSFPSFENPVLLPSGEERLIKWNNTALKDKSGNVYGSMSIGEDITERKQSEEKLRKLSQAVEQSPASAMITDTEGNIEYVNRKFCELTGYTEDEAIGKNPRILKSGEKSSEEYKELWDTITSGKEWQGEFHNKKKNGELCWEFAYISPIKNQDEEITHFLAVKEDITERKRVTEELMQERKKLGKTVKNRTRELSESLKNLESANILLKQAKEAESKFLSSMSHELRTPLNAIMGFSDLLSGQYYGRLNKEQLGFVKEIDSSSKHLLSLISDLLDVAKIDAGAMEVQLELISSDEFIDTAVAMLRTTFKKKNISVKTIINPGANVVTADIRRCKQIMVNLLSNAVKYTPDGGRVDISVMQEGDSLTRIEVSDTGIGIKAEDKERIFSEFHQADSVRDEQLGGTGIGLALTQRLVKLHEGEIGVESEPGRGSTFWFTLPLKKLGDKVAVKEKEGIITDKISFTNRRILIAEDNEVNLDMTLKMLSAKGLQVMVARNGQEAVDLALSFKPELILMDIRMPVMDGLEATKRLRAMPEFSDIPIIALTASAGSEAEEHMRAAGCTERLAKPFQSKSLFKVLQKHLKMKS